MITKYTQEQFNTAKSTSLLECECENCASSFYKPKKEIVYEINKKRGSIRFCSAHCRSTFSKNKKQKLNCLNCMTDFEKFLSEIKKTQNHFCSRSCSVTYNNKHKSTGTRRSKLEIWLEEQLTSLYPNLHIDYNKKNAIGSELDIYIPHLKLAFELNGIFHYEPIYGSDKLNQIQNNDIFKSKACLDKQIDLCIIDSSSLKYFKPFNAQKYLDIIVNIVNQRTFC